MAGTEREKKTLFEVRLTKYVFSLSPHPAVHINCDELSTTQKTIT